MNIKVKNLKDEILYVTNLYVSADLSVTAKVVSFDGDTITKTDFIDSCELQPYELLDRDNKVYVGGDMLKDGARQARTLEKETLRLMGYIPYNPLDDKEINDKSNQTEESNNNLASKIVKNDTEGLMDSDIICLEPTNDACGTMVELGQVKGMTDIAKAILELDAHCYKADTGLEYELYNILKICNNIKNKIVYTHYGDVRRTDIPEKADRRSWSINQYVYGVCLDLTNDVGLYNWKDIVKNLNRGNECLQKRKVIETEDKCHKLYVNIINELKKENNNECEGDR